MKRLAKFTTLFLLVSLPGTAWAGIYTDNLSKCLVRSTSKEDQLALIQWVFVAMAVHPAVQPYSKATPADREALTQKAGQLMQRLLTVDCRAEAILALKNEGTTTIENSFGTLGETAMTGPYERSRCRQ